MLKVILRHHFVDFYFGQRDWLNEMSKKGLRLVEMNSFFCGFEPCPPQKYFYDIYYSGSHNQTEIAQYKRMLEENGCNVIQTGINLRESYGRVYFGFRNGRFKLNKSYNNNLFIVEKTSDEIPLTMSFSDTASLRNTTLERLAIFISALLISLLLFFYEIGKGASSFLIYFLIGTAFIALYAIMVSVRILIRIKKSPSNK